MALCLESILSNNSSLLFWRLLNGHNTHGVIPYPLSPRWQKLSRNLTTISYIEFYFQNIESWTLPGHWVSTLAITSFASKVTCTIMLANPFLLINTSPKSEGILIWTWAHASAPKTVGIWKQFYHFRLASLMPSDIFYDFTYRRMVNGEIFSNTCLKYGITNISQKYLHPLLRAKCTSSTFI